LAATLTLPLAVTSGLQAQTQWVPIEENTNTQPQSQSSWEPVEQPTGTSPNLVWEPFTIDNIDDAPKFIKFPNA